MYRAGIVKRLRISFGIEEPFVLCRDLGKVGIIFQVGLDEVVFGRILEGFRQSTRGLQGFLGSTSCQFDMKSGVALEVATFDDAQKSIGRLEIVGVECRDSTRTEELVARVERDGSIAIVETLGGQTGVPEHIRAREQCLTAVRTTLDQISGHIVGAEQIGLIDATDDEYRGCRDEVGIEGKRPLSGLFRLLESEPSTAIILPVVEISRGQLGPGRRILRIARHGLLEKFDRLFVLLEVSGQGETLQVELVGLGVGGSCSHRRDRAANTQLRQQSALDPLRDLSTQTQKVGCRKTEILPPDKLVLGDLDGFESKIDLVALVKILAGEIEVSQPVRVEEKRRTLFDWRQLRRWGIGERDLPGGSEILFREEPFLVQYRWHIGAVLAFCAVQALLIAVLLLHRRMHQRAEENLIDLREQLYHVSRVKTAGELAATLAHELNQPLMAILSNAQAAGRFLEGDNPDLDEVREILREIVEDDRRAGEVIDRLRSFLKKGQRETGRVRVNDIVREVAMLVRRDTVMGGIDLDLDLGSHLPAVRGDRVQLQQVVLNLIMNGVEAMKRSDGGPRRIDLSSSLGDGTGVTVSIRDYGGGIGRQREEQLFRPFTTSRREGLGIGLSISRSIVEGHGGRIWAENHPGGGAVFSFYLPAEGEVMR